MEPVSFDKATAEKVLQATKMTLAHPLGQSVPTPNSVTGAMVAHTVVLRVIAAGTTNGFYQCKWVTTNITAAGSPAITFDETAAVQGWVYGLNGITLNNQEYYFGQLRGIKPDDNRAVFVVGGGGGGGGTFNLTVKEEDGTPTLTNIHTIILKSPNFVVTPAGAGFAEIDTVGFTGQYVVDVTCNGDGTITVAKRSMVKGIGK